MVSLEVANVIQIEKPSPNEDVVVTVMYRNNGNNNEVGDWEILELGLLLVV